jgi:hypothetical protein
LEEFDEQSLPSILKVPSKSIHRIPKTEQVERQTRTIHAHHTNQHQRKSTIWEFAYVVFAAFATNFAFLCGSVLFYRKGR